MPKKDTTSSEHNQSAFKHLFNQALITRIIKSLRQVFPTFDQKLFKTHLKNIETLEMKARVHLIRDALNATLPDDYPDALKIVLESVKDEGLKGFAIWPYTEFIQKYGLDHRNLSLRALKTLTPLFTAEWAVRPFLRTTPNETLNWLKRCASDRNPHVRRWASEGSRPRLPWGERLNLFITDPRLTLPILEILKHDTELYVRKSVANHLNDVTKDNPTLVIETLKRWKHEATPTQRPGIEWIIRHALRTLIKSGDREALKLIGVAQNARIKIRQFHADNQSVRMGGRIAFAFTVHSSSPRPEKIVIDYIIHYLRANGKLSPKVFKLKSLTIAAGSRIQLKGNHHFREVTTRSHYPGKHLLEIQINGKVVKRVAINLCAK